MNRKKHIPISHVCSIDDNESKEFPVNENLWQACSTDEDESKSIIVNKISTEDRESEYVHKSVYK